MEAHSVRLTYAETLVGSVGLLRAPTYRIRTVLRHLQRPVVRVTVV